MNNTVLQTPHDKCTGCAACMNCCPADAITMLPDEEGFLCPVVDERKCVDCGKCAAICPALLENVSDPLSGEPDCYAAWSKDDDIRRKSSSGGIFTHLATNIIQQGGAVVGARFKNDNLVEHAMIKRVEDIKQFRMSKYVQSEMGYILREVKSVLQSGKPLLFAGTPCQCAGLRAYLERDFDNLYLCDFICHGANSPMVYTYYLQELEKKYGSKVKSICFRDKSSGWNTFSVHILFENGQEYISIHRSDPYMVGFLNRKLSMFMRESCYQCRFRCVSRPTDITLADFWGIERCLPDIDNSNGISAVMIHSEKGKRLFADCMDDVESIRVKHTDIALRNPSITQSPNEGFDRKEFFRILKSGSYFDFVDNVLK